MHDFKSDFNLALEREQASRRFHEGQFAQALVLAQRILKKQKDDFGAIYMAGICSSRVGRWDAALRYLRKCLKIRPDLKHLHVDIGTAYSGQGKYDDALAAFDRALAGNLNFLPAICGKANIHERRSEYEEVRRLLEPHIRAGSDTPAPPGSPGMAVTYCNYLLHIKDYEQTIALARKHLAEATLERNARHFLCELAAKAYEKLDKYDEAFQLFKESNDLKAIPFDAEAYVRQVDTIIEIFSKRNLASLPRANPRNPPGGGTSQLPIFIASMPRSGSTLVEQIIHAHPKAFGAGEITNMMEIIGRLPYTLDSMQQYPECLGDFKQHHADALSKTYLEDLAEMGGPAIRVTNKHLQNYAVLGMVQLLLGGAGAGPGGGARVINVKRDPLDNCFSCFMAQLAPQAMPWGNDLRNLGIAYRQYERLMQHWHEMLDIPIFDVQYEDLVEDTEGGIRRIIDFCGLPWNDRCLKYYEVDRDVLTLSYDQVRQPIYKSAVKRWQKYEQYLGPLREALNESV